MKLSSKFFIFFACCISLTSCATVPIFYPTVQKASNNTQSAQKISNTEFEDFILKERFIHSSYAKLDSSIIIENKYNITTDELLYAGYTFNPKTISYCTSSVTYTGKNSLGIQGQMRSCLLDDDGDGFFERILAGGGADTYGKRFLSFSNDLNPPKAYSIISRDDEKFVEFALKYNPYHGEWGEISYVRLEDYIETEVQGGNVDVPGPDSWPITLLLQNIEIKVIKVENEILYYEVIQSTPSDKNIILDFFDIDTRSQLRWGNY